MEENLKLLKDIKNELVKITTTLATGNIENKCTLDDVIKVSNRNIEKTQVEMAKIRLDEFSQLIYNLIKNFPQTIPSIFLEVISEWNYLKTIRNTKFSSLCSYEDLSYFLTTYPNAEHILMKIKENKKEKYYIWEPFFNYLQGVNLKNIEDVLIKFSSAENVEL